MAGAMLDGQVDALDVPDRPTMVSEIQFQLQKLTDWHQTIVSELIRDLGATNAALAASQKPALDECLRALLVDVVTAEISAAFGTLGPLVGRVLRVGGLQGPHGEGPAAVSVANTESLRTLLTARAIGAAETTLTAQATNAIEARGAGSGSADGETLEAFFVGADLRFAEAITAAKVGAGRTRDDAVIAAMWNGLKMLDATRFSQAVRSRLGTVWLASQAAPGQDGFNKGPTRNPSFTLAVEVASLDAVAPKAIVLPETLDTETARAIAQQPGLWNALPKRLRRAGDLVATLGPSGEPIGGLHHGRNRRLYFQLLQQYGSREVASDYLRASGSIADLAQGTEPSRASPDEAPSYKAAYAQAAEYDSSIGDAIREWYDVLMGRVDASASLREIASWAGSRLRLPQGESDDRARP